jgi:uncharacterized protein (DUF362 family)
MANVVSLFRTQFSSENIKDSISKGIKSVNFDLVSPIKLVAIKPNLCYYWDSATGQTTDTRVVSGIIDFVREKYGEDVDIKVVEADASAMRTKYAFKCLGYEKLSKEKKIELLNLSNDVLIEKVVSVGKHELSFQVPQILLSSDLFINVPKLKYMRETKITCAMKNIFGCIGYARKAKYHPILNEAIVGINKILRPHLTVVDGLVALGRFPVKLGLIMTGVDTFSVDWIASRVMGYKPSSVKFLKIAMKEKIGDPRGLVTCGERVEDFAQSFPKQGFMPKKYLWAFQLSLLKAYQKLSGDIIPPALED